MKQDRIDESSWRCLSAYDLPVSTFNSAQQKDFLTFVTQSPDTFVRRAEVRFFAGAMRFFTDYVIEGEDSNEALDSAVMTSLGGLMQMDIRPIEVSLHDVHIAPQIELDNNPHLDIHTKPFGVRDRGLIAIRSAQLFYQEAC